jgi:hypothetical protein
MLHATSALAASNSPAAGGIHPRFPQGLVALRFRQQLQLQHAAGTDFGGRWQPSRNKASDILARWSQPAVLRTAGVIEKTSGPAPRRLLRMPRASPRQVGPALHRARSFFSAMWRLQTFALGTECRVASTLFKRRALIAV